MATFLEKHQAKTLIIVFQIVSIHFINKEDTFPPNLFLKTLVLLPPFYLLKYQAKRWANFEFFIYLFIRKILVKYAWAKYLFAFFHEFLS